jgi:hypothetical protein
MDTSPYSIETHEDSLDEPAEVMIDEPARKRRWFRFSLRTLMVVVLLLSLPLGWLAMRMAQAERQRRAVEAIREAGGEVYYLHKKGVMATPIVRLRMSLAELVGWNLIWDVLEVDLSSAASISDDTLEHVRGLSELEMLYVRRKQLSEKDIEAIQQALPNCKIHWEPSNDQTITPSTPQPLIKIGP